MVFFYGSKICGNEFKTGLDNLFWTWRNLEDVKLNFSGNSATLIVKKEEEKSSEMGSRHSENEKHVTSSFLFIFIFVFIS